MSLSKTFLAVGIAVVFAAFVIYGINVAYEPPKYDYLENGCYLKYACDAPARECEKRFINETNSNSPLPLPPEYAECYTNMARTAEFKQCQESLDACNTEFEKKSPQYAHAKNTFIMLLIIGIAAIIFGSRMAVEGVGSGFIGGGVLLLLWSLVNSWIYLYHLDKYFKLAGLGVALAVLVYVAHKKLDKEK